MEPGPGTDVVVHPAEVLAEQTESFAMRKYDDLANRAEEIKDEIEQVQNAQTVNQTP